MRCAPDCRGCRYIHLTYQEGLRLKEEWLGRALPGRTGLISPIRTPGPDRLWGYRERVRLHAAVVDRRWRFGMMRQDRLIPLEDCPVQSQRVNRTLRLLSESLPPELPLAFVAVTFAQVALVFKSRGVPHLDIEWSKVAQAGCRGIWGHANPVAGRRIFSRGEWRLLWGEERSLGDLGTFYGPWSFTQQIPELHRDSIDEAVRFLSPGVGLGAADLYCGDGVSLRALSSAGAETLGVEISGLALRMAKLNSPSSKLLQGTCAQRTPQIGLFMSRFQENQRLAYVNPPRSGLEAEVVDLLGTTKVRRLAYLSCSAGTLNRDLDMLEARGYRCRKIIPYDFFPWTDHVECLALLDG
ncbi:(Uracil-5)-methyltransferase [Thermanaerovibrio acidaminovorans DSM 6589]|uniref:(Uracil-5)-methyltransferase n=1 Tax=Thermanaerovibrio acidaminovorans (strain ATCC 49978 / DSM 6589 / Su883) TaxID=525903 RepID=D1B953_THEAS|nr:class I SAM-dependent RNA methyltransferase [Thermanaerovibrio acidaminovorans]ACZ18806.1 (Uracil-5)-methyltransferase [Thermanaerovibrio acidaminovorans DSM 6589]